MRLAILASALALMLEAAQAAAIQDIRIARHPDHIRVVLDLDAPVTFTAAGESSFVLHGLADGSAVMNAGARDAPLSRVLLRPDGQDARLSFEANAKLRAQAFLLAPNSSGGHRLVVDLYPDKTEQVLHPAQAASAAPPRPVAGAVAALPPPVSVPPANAYAAVPPSMPPQVAVEPTPFEPVENGPPPSAPAATGSPTNIAPPSTMEMAPGANVSRPEGSAAALPAAPPAASATLGPRALHAERALDRGEAQAACGLADEILHADPHNLRALVVLGSCRLALGDALAARAAFTTALEGDPSYHRALIGLAQSEAKLGNIAGARASYARVLADNPPTDEAHRIIGAIDALNSGAVRLAAPSGRGS